MDHHRRQPRRDRPRRRAARRRPVPVTQVEQALIAIAVAGAGDQISHTDRYSTRPDPLAVRYGATIGFRDGWKIFLSCYGTTRPGQPYHPASHL